MMYGLSILNWQKKKKRKKEKKTLVNLDFLDYNTLLLLL
jgi:hypothetical protein